MSGKFARLVRPNSKLDADHVPLRMAGTSPAMTCGVGCGVGSSLHPPLDQHALDLGDRFRRIEVLGAGLGAIHDGVAAV